MQQSQKRLSLIVLLVQAFLQLIHSSPGEDIATARKSFLSGEKSDFLGAFASKFYSLIPESPFDWSFNLMLLQSTLVICALILFVRNLKLTGKHFLILLIAQSIFLSFGSQQSRDGTLFAFVFFGIALLNRNQQDNSLSMGHFYEFLAYSFIVFGLSFRPWLSPAVLLLVIVMKVRIQKLKGLISLGSLAIFVTILCAPIVTEAYSSHFLKTSSRYPFQLVIIHDLTSTACLAANTNSINSAIQGLSPLSNSSNLSGTLCQFYRPNTWQAVANKNSDDDTTRNLIEPIRLTSSAEEFHTLRSNWASLILSDIRSYLQIKFMLSSQVIFASQTKLSFDINSEIAESVPSNLSQLLTRILKVLMIPWFISSQLYLITPGMFLIFFFSFRRWLSVYVDSQVILYLILSSAIVSLVSTVLLFVSDNGRYLTPILLLCYFLLILPKSRVKV